MSGTVRLRSSGISALSLLHRDEQTLARGRQVRSTCHYARWTVLGLDANANEAVQFGYGLNYLINIENAVTVDVDGLSEIWNLLSTKVFPIGASCLHVEVAHALVGGHNEHFLHNRRRGRNSLCSRVLGNARLNKKVRYNF